MNPSISEYKELFLQKNKFRCNSRSSFREKVVLLRTVSIIGELTRLDSCGNLQKGRGNPSVFVRKGEK